MRVVAVYSTKGGVGKTTTAVNLAWQASQTLRVLLWDLDPQGAATFLLKVKPKVKGGVASLVDGRSRTAAAIRSSAFADLDVLPADASYRDLDLVLDAAKKSDRQLTRLLEQVSDDYDLVILDCPPGASLVAENAVHSADAVVVPLVPAPLTMRSLEQVEQVVADSSSKASIVAFFSMVDRRKSAHRDTVARLPASHASVSDVAVPATVTIERMGSHRAPLQSFAPSSEAARAYSALWDRVQSVVKAKAGKRRR